MDNMYVLFLTALMGCILSHAEQWYEQGSKSYFIYTGSMNKTHTNAIYECEARDSALAVVTGTTDRDFLARHTERFLQYFIGYTGPTDCACQETPDKANCATCTDQWRWTNGRDKGYSDWASERPLSGRGCAVIKGAATGGTMDATGCRNQRKYICQHDCMPNLCKKQGCQFTSSIYQCTCNADYTGAHCDTKIDDCKVNSCLNGATCVDGVNAYNCECAAGFTGLDCETNIDDCKLHTCNNGTCVDAINSFACDCFPGYYGYECQYDIDECESNPCQNNGTCNDQVNAYSCKCADGDAERNCLPSGIAKGRIDGGNKSDDDDSGVLIAFVVGVVFLVVMFTLMIITIIYYRRFMSKERSSPPRNANNNTTPTEPEGKIQD